MKARIMIAALAALLAGCVKLAVPAPPTQEYLLDYAPPESDGAPLPVVLRLTHLTIASTYSRSGIMYRVGDHEIGAYAYHQWVTDLSSMVGDLLARDFAAANQYRAVLNGPARLRPDYELGGVIEGIEERVGNGTAHLQIRVLLRRLSPEAENKVVFQKNYVADEPTQGENRSKLVEAMSRGLQQISESLRRDVYEAIAADLRESVVNG